MNTLLAFLVAQIAILAYALLAARLIAAARDAFPSIEFFTLETEREKS